MLCLGLGTKNTFSITSACLALLGMTRLGIQPQQGFALPPQLDYLLEGVIVVPVDESLLTKWLCLISHKHVSFPITSSAALE